uniref:Uncharacterized protein n=1 Tax=Picea glauca TaxID=3330 RepID=A0A101LU64_PICGL|nr:hypothetical protein ABT39_MTgene2671 [Picea glauca]
MKIRKASDLSGTQPSFLDHCGTILLICMSPLLLCISIHGRICLGNRIHTILLYKTRVWRSFLDRLDQPL